MKSSPPTDVLFLHRREKDREFTGLKRKAVLIAKSRLVIIFPILTDKCQRPISSIVDIIYLNQQGVGYEFCYVA